MPFKFYCRSCYQKLEAPEELYGSETLCPQCGEKLSIPDPRRLLDPAAEQLEQVIMSCPVCSCQRLKMPSGRYGDARCPNCTTIIPLQPRPPEESTDGVMPALHDYLLVRKLGSGGSGTVYEARQLKLNNRSVAIKILAPELLATWDISTEADALVRLSHPSIVRLFDVAEEEQLKGLVMELVTAPHGEPLSLRDILHVNGGQLPLEAAIKTAATVAHALSYAHRQKVLHLDLKPENLLVDHLGLLRIVDFGIARLQTPRPDSDSTIQVRTISAEPLGTPGYVAPERWEANHQPLPRLDVYSLGAILYETITGDVPAGRFPLPSENNPELPKSIDAVIEKALHFHPEKRYQSMAEFSEALNNLLHTVKAVGGVSVPAILQGTDTMRIRKPVPSRSNQTTRNEPMTFKETTVDAPERSARKIWPWLLGSAVMVVLMFSLARIVAGPETKKKETFFAAVQKRSQHRDTAAAAGGNVAATSSTKGESEQWYRDAENHFWGNRVPVDLPRSLTLYRQAAAAEYAPAVNRLGEIALYGDGGEPEPEKAVKYFRQAAELGNPKGLFNLGECYYYGLGGVKKDYDAAVNYYQKAVGVGSVHAVYALGRCYRLGHGLERNPARAGIMLRQAADEGFAPARELLARIKENPAP